MPGFVVVALGMEPEVSYASSDPLIVMFKVFASVDVPEVRSQSVAAAADNQVQQV